MTTPITQTEITALEGCLGKLNASGQKFAASLIRQFNRKGRLSAGQEPYVLSLTEQALNPPKPVSKKVRGDMTKLYNFFHQARKNLKYPKIILAVPRPGAGEDGVEALKLHMTGPKSSQPDTVSITLPDRQGRYPGGVWLGRVDAGGNWDIPPKFSNDAAVITPVKKLLANLAADPHTVAMEHGKLTGNCCFCNYRIGDGEDKRSRNVGYGPGCAKKYGLTAKWNAAAKIKNPVKRPAGSRRVTTRGASQ